MPRYSQVSPVPSTATVSQSFTNPPTIGPVLDIGKPRVLIGWNHQDDTPNGTMHGQLFACVSIDKGAGHEKLSIYDTSGNRSKNPGEVVFCGMANFTMIRYVLRGCPPEALPSQNLRPSFRCVYPRAPRRIIDGLTLGSVW
jgi:hypothetical protein